MRNINWTRRLYGDVRLSMSNIWNAKKVVVHMWDTPTTICRSTISTWFVYNLCTFFCTNTYFFLVVGFIFNVILIY